MLAAPVPRNPQREQAIRVRLERRNGTVLAHPNGPQASPIVTSLIGAVFYAIHLLEDNGSIAKILSHPTRAHGLPPFSNAPMEEIVGAAVLGTLEQGLGKEAFTDEVKDAWAVAYATLSGAMIKAAAAAT